MESLQKFLDTHPELIFNFLISLSILFIMSGIKFFVHKFVEKKIHQEDRRHHFKRITLYIIVFITIILLGITWIKGIQSLSTFIGLLTAGIAIAMHDTVANIVGWIFIIWRKPFSIGERIQINNNTGDVIDIRLFQFSMIEIGNWVDAQQSTGRIIHVPNSKILRETVANYDAGFHYIWHEVPVLITFESNWKKAKAILEEIAIQTNKNQPENARKQIMRAKQRYLIFYSKLTPIVYTTVKDSGVLLTIRYIARVRGIRLSEQTIWELILDRFEASGDIDLAYPTTRFYKV